MDLLSIEQRLVAGEELKVKYQYPIENPDGRSARHGVRTDKLLDVSVELNRFYTKFRGEKPIWVDIEEVIEITPDDGVYEEFKPQ